MGMIELVEKAERLIEEREKQELADYELMDILFEMKKGAPVIYSNNKQYCGGCLKRIPKKIKAKYCHKCGKRLSYYV